MVIQVGPLRGGHLDSRADIFNVMAIEGVGGGVRIIPAIPKTGIAG